MSDDGSKPHVVVTGMDGSEESVAAGLPPVGLTPAPVRE
jgi:hypothetical protein